MSSPEWVQINEDRAELRTSTGHVLADVAVGIHNIVHFRLFAGTQVRRAGMIGALAGRCMEVGKREVQRILKDDLVKLRAALQDSEPPETRRTGE